MYRMSQSAAFIVALLIMILTMIFAPVVHTQEATPTPECYIMEDGTLVCISHADATAVPATPTPQPATPTPHEGQGMFVVVWLPVVAR